MNTIRIKKDGIEREIAENRLTEYKEKGYSIMEGPEETEKPNKPNKPKK